jgi:hypothetical protein
VKRGLPDLLILYRIPAPMTAMWMQRALGIELKTARGRLSPAQSDTQQRWFDLGHMIHVAHSLEEVQDILIECRVPMRHRLKFWVERHNPKFWRDEHDRPGRLASARHFCPSRSRKPKNPLPVVLAKPS